MKKPKEHLCRRCKTAKLRLFNGIPSSKYCVACRVVVCKEKKEKYTKTKTYVKKMAKTLHAKAWKAISKHIRFKAANEFGMVFCYTCGGMQPWQATHCSHFHHGKLDFDERNLKACCNYCNTHLSGNLGKYATRLIKENGLEWMDKLELDSNTTTYSIEDLENIIKQYS